MLIIDIVANVETISHENDPHDKVDKNLDLTLVFIGLLGSLKEVCFMIK